MLVTEPPPRARTDVERLQDRIDEWRGKYNFACACADRPAARALEHEYREILLPALRRASTMPQDGSRAALLMGLDALG
jgi:hypothetical protein